MQDITFPLGTWAMLDQITVVCRHSLSSGSVVLCAKCTDVAGLSFPVKRSVSVGTPGEMSSGLPGLRHIRGVVVFFLPPSQSRKIE